MQYTGLIMEPAGSLHAALVPSSMHEVGNQLKMVAFAFMLHRPINFEPQSRLII
jgi:hypothetical protein